jgi:hypothetical protein
VVFYDVMQAAERASSEQTVTWFVQPDRAGARPRARKGWQLRLGDDGATSAHAVIVSSLFLVLLAASLLFGGHAAIDPLLRAVSAARDAKAVGEVVYSTADGKLCRHMTFDNATSEMLEGNVVPCPDDIVREEFRNSSKGFAWGEHLAEH